MYNFKRKNAQFLGEYSVVVTIVVLALIAMTYFIQRRLAAGLNDARGYALLTLDSDIKDVHSARGGAAYNTVLAEYEPYYLTKYSTMTSNTDITVFINGISGDYVREISSPTAINAVSTEGFAEDDDYSP